MSTRVITLRMPPLSDVTRRCTEAQKAITQMQWTLEDARRDQDADEIVFTDIEVRDWIETLRDAAVALAFASMLKEVDA